MTAGPRDHFTQAFDRDPCGHLTVDEGGLVVAVNDTYLEWTGLGRDEVVGHPMIHLLPAPDQIFYETRFAPILRLTGEVREASVRVRRKDGTLAVLLNARLNRSVEGGQSMTRIAIFDATQRQDYERQLLAAQRVAESSESRVRTLQYASNAFAECLGEADLAEALVASTRTAMMATACAVVLIGESGEPSLVAGVDSLERLTRELAERSDMDSLRHTGPLTLATIDEIRHAYPEIADGLRHARIESLSIIPIENHDEVMGALICFFGRARTMAGDDVELQQALARQAGQVLTRIRLQNELRALALYDPLTGVANRRLIREHLIHSMASARAQRRPMALLMLDIDNFKSINDARGHPAGDTVLKWVASQINESVRIDDVVGRFGGDEFIVVCHDADEMVAVEVADRIRQAIARFPESLPPGMVLSASVGIAASGPGRVNGLPEDLFAAADSALYRSKRAGKDSVTVDSL